MYVRREHNHKTDDDSFHCPLPLNCFPLSSSTHTQDVFTALRRAISKREREKLAGTRYLSLSQAHTHFFHSLTRVISLWFFFIGVHMKRPLPEIRALLDRFRDNGINCCSSLILIQSNSLIANS